MNTLLKLIFAATLAGCAATQVAPPAPAPAPVKPAAPGPDQVALQEGIELYNKGDFNGAIKRLGTAEISAGSKARQLEALKYQAFSYCVTSRKTLCGKQFEKALALDPAFDLGPGEHGHPLWGPVFTRLKKAR
ncbi:TssQ family T6SS-associated lipoprotein [Massilia soli]|uniref:TssQ family T6SS-associated lipoprotein n=1 Tax=Massilia soli TaxID=2792854 RepID=A0ABS7SPM7_9BURK|nr:TssQ family T6SS-associated lipoprotein [Massilia soli]MBZ2208138.1 TssQ family T6SS-associated lipoprotein [Massilia soli]